MRNIKYALLAIFLIGFIAIGVINVRDNKQKIQLEKLEVKSKETQLIELNTKYDEVIKLQTNSEKEKQEQLKQIQELEQERQRLEGELQAKRQRQKEDEERIAQAAQRATGTATAQAAPVTESGCESLRSRLATKGFGGAELDAAIRLAQVESGCRSYIANSSSGACNYFQELPCGKWGGTGDIDAHINGAINYMQARYGSWQNALAVWHSRSPHWW